MTTPYNQKLTTGRLYWLPYGATDGYIDFGNIVDYKHDPKLTRVEHLHGALGRRKADLSFVVGATLQKSFTLDEDFSQVLALVYLATQNANVTQTSQTGINATITPVVGRVFALGYQQVTLTYAAGTNGGLSPVLQQGVDFNLDAVNGFITPLNATYPPWNFTFNCAAVTSLNFTALNNLLTRGTFLLLEYDQQSPVPLAQETFAGQVIVTAWGDDKADKFHEYTVEVLITP